MGQQKEKESGQLRVSRMPTRKTQLNCNCSCRSRFNAESDNKTQERQADSEDMLWRSQETMAGTMHEPSLLAQSNRMHVFKTKHSFAAVDFNYFNICLQSV